MATVSAVPRVERPGLWVDPGWTPSDPATFAVVIGVSRYPHLAGGDRPAPNTYGLSQLHVSALTAFRFFQWLRDEHDCRAPAQASAVPLARCWLLLSPTRAECEFEPQLQGNALEPTLPNCRAALIDWFNTMRALPRKVAEASRAFFFFSGHGLEIEPERQILLPSDYLEPTSGTPYMALSTSNLALGVKTLNVHDFFFLLDACRNDDEGLRLIHDLNGESILTVYPPYKFARPPCNTPIFYASASGTQAWEPRHPSQGLSVFGQAILDGLRARPGGLVPDCAAGGSCAVRVHLLDGHLKKRVAEIAGQGHATQYAVLGGSPIDTNTIVTLVPQSKSFRAGALGGSPLGPLDTRMSIPSTWDRFVLTDWRPTGQAQNRGEPAPHQVFGSERMTAIWLTTVRLRRLDTGRLLRKNGGYVIHGVARHRTEVYRVEFSLTADRGSYWMELSDSISRFGLLLPDELGEEGRRDTLERPRFLLEMDFGYEPDPGRPRPIGRLDLGLSLTDPNVWLQRAATVAWLYRRATLPETLGHPAMSALLSMLGSGIQSPLAAVVVATVLLKAGRIEQMNGWIAELADRFRYLPDGPVLFAEWRLQLNKENRLPADALNATLTLMDRGLPFTTDSLSYARRQVNAYLLQEDLDGTRGTDSKLSGTNSEPSSASIGAGASSPPWRRPSRLTWIRISSDRLPLRDCNGSA